MSDAAAFDPALLDALARCFAEAAVRRLLANGPKSDVEANSMTSNRKPSRRANRGPALLITESSQSCGTTVEDVRSITDTPSSHVIPVVGDSHGR